MKTILWIILALFLIHQIDDFFNVPTFFRIFTSAIMFLVGYFVYKKYIPENWK